MWLYDLRPKFKVREDRTRLMWLGIAGNVVILLIATFLMVGGMYGSMCALSRLVPRPLFFALTGSSDPQSRHPRRLRRIGWSSLVVRRQLGLGLSTAADRVRAHRVCKKSGQADRSLAPL